VARFPGNLKTRKAGATAGLSGSVRHAMRRTAGPASSGTQFAWQNPSRGNLATDQLQSYLHLSPERATIHLAVKKTEKLV
jgi:hypothetical protein